MITQQAPLPARRHNKEMRKWRLFHLTREMPMNIAPLPSASTLLPPANACDCHAHIMGPFDRFPLPNNPGYLPPLAPAENFVKLLDTLRFGRGVVVQSSSHGRDPRVLLDALARFPSRLRGVALAYNSVSDADLEAMNAGGVRGLRFTGMPYTGSTASGHSGSVPIWELFEMAPRLKALGWHAQLWMHCDQLSELAPRLTRLGIPLVLDHMGRFDTASGLQHPGFQNLLALLRAEAVWIKMVPQRNSEQPPDYADVRPFQAALIEANADRLVWASDWPHTNMGKHAPDAGHLLDLFGEWVSDASLRTRILATNPAKLYGFKN